MFQFSYKYENHFNMTFSFFYLSKSLGMFCLPPSTIAQGRPGEGGDMPPFSLKRKE